MTDPKIDGLIGLARRSGNLALGTMATEVAIKRKKACLVILACDLADSTREAMERLCRRYNVPWFNYADRNHLGRIVGREARAVLAVTSRGFAESIQRLQPSGE